MMGFQWVLLDADFVQVEEEMQLGSWKFTQLIIAS